MASSSTTSSSSSSPSSSGAEYITETVSLVYPSAFLPEKSARPFRVITPAASSLQLNKRKRDLLDTGTAQPGANYTEMSQFRVVVRQPFVAAAPGSSFGPSGKLKAKPVSPASICCQIVALAMNEAWAEVYVLVNGEYATRRLVLCSESVAERGENVSVVWTRCDGPHVSNPLVFVLERVSPPHA